MATQADPKELDLQAQIASINESLANAARHRAEIEMRQAEQRRINAEIDQRQVEQRRINEEIEKSRAEQRRIDSEIDQRREQTRLEPWKLLAGGVTSGAALFAAAAAFTKLFL